MDELQAIREAYGEPEPPTLREMTETRALVIGGSPRRRVRLGWRFRIGLGAVAAGAAVAVAVTVTGTGAPAPPPATVDLGREAVLAAAAKAAAQPVGKYWFSDQISGQSYIVRAGTGDYAIVGAHSEMFGWTGAEPGMGQALHARDIPARPLTKRDAELWRKAGSPSKFRVWSNDHYYTYDRSTSKWDSDAPDARAGGRFFVQGTGRELTLDEVQRLPGDPAALAEMFYKPRTPKDGARVGPLSRLGTPGAKLGVTARLLEDVPLPPRVRAGLMRALAAQPGVRSVGAATDPLGRTGVALVADDAPSTVDGTYGAPPEERGTYRSRSELLFDRATGELLAEQRVLTEPGGAYRDREPGFVINYWIVRASGWTDAEPKPPAKPPF
ncbi:CU044_5270 family protein [Actinomadura bangladeshensis]|uniref:CU044_5270 family protein n=1 Tax=Actinomadura bangladeshensis TaxID=453573 RepID=A0A4R4NUY0_9ACTN|nr:CU044_5270 family protein [Actinomadura bangladeshensis]TDC11900.1 hypothetical protein E1284_26165 [Actinomadura bangladeshensis]